MAQASSMPGLDKGRSRHCPLFSSFADLMGEGKFGGDDQKQPHPLRDMEHPAFQLFLIMQIIAFYAASPIHLLFRD